MDNLDWVKKETATCRGTNAFQEKINNFAQSYNTNIILTRVANNVFSQNNVYTVEVWFNFSTQLTIITAYCTEYNDSNF